LPATYSKQMQGPLTSKSPWTVSASYRDTLPQRLEVGRKSKL